MKADETLSRRGSWVRIPPPAPMDEPCGVYPSSEIGGFGEIAAFAMHLAKSGYKESTIRPLVRALKAIARRTNLLNPEEAKAYLARAEMTESRKELVGMHLSRFYEYKGIPFERPRYRRVETLPFIPLEGEIDALIAGVGKKTAAFLQLLKETGCRPGEAWDLRWIDLDPHRNTITIRPEKGSRARQFQLSNRLIAMLNRLPHTCEYIFRNPKIDRLTSLESFSRNFSKQRRKIAERLQNPRILRISFKTLRHWKATMEYHRTKDILHVMHLLGHKNIKNTLVYAHLVDIKDDEYICKTAKTIEDAKALIESGFEYVTDVGDVKLFRKRK